MHGLWVVLHRITRVCLGNGGGDASIADHLDLPLKAFMRRFVRRVGDRSALVELSKNYDSGFLRDKKCTIYPV